ncbi:MAG: phosphoribosylanthranilate isomerase [Acidimicrobiia bacterium]
MTWVKVCGMTRVEDIEAAEAAGTDAIGLVLITESPRVVSIDRAADLAATVTTQAILLTKDMPPEELIAAALATGVDGVQPYGLHVTEAAKAAGEVGLMVLLPVSLQTDLGSIPDEQIPLFDNPNSLGGSGQEFDHARLPPTDRRFVLAGGLAPDNVREMVGSTGAWGVDAVSRLELRPGIKDHDRVSRFIREAKRA